MKLMLEYGAQFGGGENSEIPPEIEHQFLLNILAFEQQWEKNKTQTLFEAVKSPSQFLPHVDIPEEKIEQSWNELKEWLDRFNIRIIVSNRKIGPRELYRFTTEELFREKMEFPVSTEFINHFQYEDYHPDPGVENSRLALNCIFFIFNNNPSIPLFKIRENQLRLNEHYPLNNNSFDELIRGFKDRYENLVIKGVQVVCNETDKNTSVVKGEYDAEAIMPGDILDFHGKWMVIFEREAGSEQWEMTDILIEDIRF